MSRTIRRTHGDLLARTYAPTADAERQQRLICYDFHRSGLTIQKYWEQKRARYHRDHKSGRWHVPSWYGHMYRTIPERMQLKKELHRCMKVEDFSDFLNPVIPNNAAWMWW